jgi:Sulfotransferase domain
MSEPESPQGERAESEPESPQGERGATRADRLALAPGGLSEERAESDGVRLAMWSGPRNISTALMRSWENRPDTRVVDEPLYAHYLSETGLNHPGRDEVIAAGETSWQAVVAELTAPVEGVYYQKHMTHHLIPQLPRDWITALTNVLLIRDPVDVVSSYVRSRADVVAEDIGLVQQNELYDQLGAGVPVIDAADFLRNPEGYLRWLCDYIDVEFTDRMLHWPAGPRDSDGIWAPYWYGAVLASTGFEPYRPRQIELAGAALEAAQRSRPHYERLYEARLRL